MKAAYGRSDVVVGLCRLWRGHIDIDFRTCHETLKGGRGAALALIWMNAEDLWMTWASVGDVEGNAGPNTHKAAITQIGGTLGITFDRLIPQSHRLAPGDLIILTTDGVLRDYATKVALNQSAEQTAMQILREFRRPQDDLAMVIEVGAT